MKKHKKRKGNKVMQIVFIIAVIVSFLAICYFYLAYDKIDSNWF